MNSVWSRGSVARIHWVVRWREARALPLSLSLLCVALTASLSIDTCVYVCVCACVPLCVSRGMDCQGACM